MKPIAPRCNIEFCLIRRITTRLVKFFVFGVLEGICATAQVPFIFKGSKYSFALLVKEC